MSEQKPEQSADILKKYNGKISTKIAVTATVNSAVTDAVFEEYYQMIKAQEYISLGGIDYAREILEEALGDMRALRKFKDLCKYVVLMSLNKLMLLNYLHLFKKNIRKQLHLS